MNRIYDPAVRAREICGNCIADGDDDTIAQVDIGAFELTFDEYSGSL